MKRRTKILILTPNKEGKLEFTQKQLEDLLDNAYEDGYQDGCAQQPFVYPVGTRDTDELNFRWWEGPSCTNKVEPAEMSKSISYVGEVPKTQLYGCDDNCAELVGSNCIDNCIAIVDSNCVDNCVKDYTTLCRDNIEKSVSSNKMIYANL